MADPLGILVALSVIPPLLLAVWVRNMERYQKQSMGSVLGAFVYGGTLGVLVALMLNLLFDTSSVYFSATTGLDAVVLSVVVAAPFLEELAKGLGLGGTRRHILELEDGIIYGAAIGLGFAASENLLYGVTAYLQDGSGIAIQVVVVRILSSTLLHAASSSLLGLGYGATVLEGGAVWRVLPFYLVAVGLHAAYNFLVLSATVVGSFLSVIMVWFLAVWIRRRIKALDAMASAAG